MSVTASVIRTAKRVDRFTYAIRNIVAEAMKVEAAGKKVRYLNIGDPNQFGFLTPPHLIAAVEKAMRDGHNGYVPSPGIVEAREAAAADFVSRGVKVARTHQAWVAPWGSALMDRRRRIPAATATGVIRCLRPTSGLTARR